MNIIKSKNLDDINNSTIKKRVERAKSGRSTEFILLKDGSEAAFLSYEDWSDESAGFIYEIYVLPNFRGQGLARELLDYAEDNAERLNCSIIRLKPHPLDSDTKKNKLINWYQSKGYVLKNDNDREVMEKYI